MTNKSTILIVDDSTESRLVLSMLLEDQYDIIEADSGELCIKLIEQKMPDILLLDVNMPGMTGYEVCTHLRKQSTTEKLPIIFVSALETVEERLQGYEAGGDGYIIKPVDGETLLEKISSRLALHRELSQVQQEASDAMKIAMEAMTVSSELGQIIEFIKILQRVNTLDEVGQAVLNISQNFSLEVSAMIITESARIYIGCSSDSMEARVLDRAAQIEDRIKSVGIHSIVRNDHIILLIKNMPHDNENLYGRLKDHLAVLMNMAEGHIIALDALMQVGRQRKKLVNEIISVAEKQIKLTSNKIHQHEKTSRQVIENMLLGLEDMLFGLGLDEDQEKKLMGLANETSVKIQEASQATENMDEEIGVILESLYDFIDKE